MGGVLFGLAKKLFITNHKEECKVVVGYFEEEKKNKSIWDTFHRKLKYQKNSTETQKNRGIEILNDVENNLG